MQINSTSSCYFLQVNSINVLSISGVYQFKDLHMCRELSLQQAKAASRLEEEFQVEIWGVVEGGHDMDRYQI